MAFGLPEDMSHRYVLAFKVPGFSHDLKAFR